MTCKHMTADPFCYMFKPKYFTNKFLKVEFNLTPCRKSADAR